VEIPDREWFKASEVCEIASVQPYVLRSWEIEFPALGITKSAGGPRSYRRADVERVLRVKHLVFVEGLTLAGARRRIEADSAGDASDAPPMVTGEARQKLDGIKRDLRALIDLLDTRGAEAKAASWPPRSQPTLLEFEAGGAEADTAGGNGKRPAAKKRAPRGA
jgi:DNA-binding transcriptional MerR regulator